MAVASSSSSTHGWNYDVFLNFRGKDIRKNFISHLHSALSSKGINTFIDNDLERGKDVSDSLLQTIEGSQIALTVFSHHYASSTYCLDELVKIWECRQSKGQFVLPIFYKVDPTDVQEVTGTYAEELAKHEVDSNTLEKWTSALKQVSILSGEPYRDTEDLVEAAFIKRIVKIVCNRLDRELLHVSDHPIGLDFHIQRIERELDVGSNDHVHKVGIWGMGGIGKTTLAKAIYNRLAHQFEASCFLRDVREKSSNYDGIAKMQEAILFEAIRYEKPLMGNFEAGISLIRERLKGKRVLIVFDDVDHMDHLNKLVGGLDWFYKGSRIIITTRDKHLLSIHNVEGEYELSELCHRDALELFSWHAFKKSQPDEDYVWLSQCILQNAGGLPLALIVLGSSLYGRDRSDWEDVIAELDRIPKKDITRILRISYDGLEDDEQRKIFLYIACFFKGRNKDDVMNSLLHLGYKPRLKIKVLIEKSLLCVDERDEIQMHDMLQTMGRDIAKYSTNEVGCRLLCFKEDILSALSKNYPHHDDIEGIMLDLSSEEEIEMDEEIFSKLNHLKVFFIRNANLHANAPEQFPSNLLGWSENPTSKMKFNNLILIDFHRCKFPRRTPNFPAMCNLKQLRFSHCDNLEEVDESIINLQKLQELDFDDCSSLQKFPNFSESKHHKNLQHLKIMRFRRCISLTEIPNLSAIPNLEILNLNLCKRLEKIDESVGFLEKLTDLRLKNCESLSSCPSLVRSNSLRSLKLRHCYELKKFPTVMETITGVTKLDLSKTSIEEIPPSIEHFTKLEYLCIERCDNLVNISDRIYKLQHLQWLKVFKCPKLEKFPMHHGEEEIGSSSSSTSSSNGVFPQLKELIVKGCSLEKCDFLKIPNSFQELWSIDLSRNNLASVDFVETPEYFLSLEWLNLSGNKFLCIPQSISRFVNLGILQVNGCKRLAEIPQLPPTRLFYLDAGDCESLETFSQLTSTRRGQWFNLSNCRKLASENWMRQVVENISRTATTAEEDEITEYPIELTIALPQDMIPRWFEYFSESHSLSFVIPSDHHNHANFIGIAFCFIFQFQKISSTKFLKRNDEELFSISINDALLLCLGLHKNFKTFFTHKYSLPSDQESNNVWFSFLRWDRDMPTLLPSDEVSFKVSTQVRWSMFNYKEINCKGCGAHLVYKMDGEHGSVGFTSSNNHQWKGKGKIEE